MGGEETAMKVACLVVANVLVLALVLLATAPEGDCTRSGDCKQGHYCKSGTCVPKEAK